jgi:hypothetical protein
MNPGLFEKREIFPSSEAGICQGDLHHGNFFTISPLPQSAFGNKPEEGR